MLVTVLNKGNYLFQLAILMLPNPFFILLHVDIWGPCPTVSMYGHKYFLTIVDYHTRFVWVILMCSKSETQTHLQTFITCVENQFDTKVKTI